MSIGEAASVDRKGAADNLSAARLAAVIGIAIFGAALAGIATPLNSTLISLWPANSLLLGTLVRWPRLASWQTWAVAFAAYVLADILTGTDLRGALYLSVANIAGVAIGVLLYGCVDPAHRSLRRPDSILILTTIVGAAALTSATVAAGLAPVLPRDDRFSGFAYRLAAEFSCYLLILPLILVCARPSLAWHLAMSSFLTRDHLTKAMPALALVGSIAASAVIGGSGALAVASPALIWCALAYGLVGAATATLAFGFLTTLGAAAGWLDFGVADQTTSGAISIRVGVALLALGPLTVASIESSRRVVMRNLETMANTDPLTGLHNRRSFDELGTVALRNARQDRRWSSVAMADIDDFKHLNDAFGHQAGDRMLVLVGAILRSSLPTDAILSRFGGDEFVVLLPGGSPGDAQRMLATASARFSAVSTTIVDTGSTISFGLAHDEGHVDASLETLVNGADAALYIAKRRGALAAPAIDPEGVDVPVAG